MSRNSDAPKFAGNRMPLKIDPRGLDEGGEETTRRIAFQPSFEPVSNFQPPSLKESRVAAPAKVSPVVSKGKVDLAKGFWELNKVPTLPQFHPLERTAVFVPNTSPKEVSMRISDVLRERSIEATFDDDKAKAKCTTAAGVDFRVWLYRGRGKFEHGIIVEVQRRFGSSNTFHDDATAILEAAEGKVPPPPPLISKSNLPLVVSDNEDDYEPSDGFSSLEMVSKMLASTGYDTHFLALQMVASLTDASKMGVKTARSTSEALLQMSDDNIVGSKILSLVIDKRGDDDLFKLRSMAFQILGNAVQAVNGRIPVVLKDQLREVLLAELRNADKTPRIALQAARLAEFFVLDDDTFHSALETALEAGKVRYAALEHQAQRCLNILT